MSTNPILADFFENLMKTIGREFTYALAIFLLVMFVGMICVPYLLRQIRNDVDMLEHRSKKALECLRAIEGHLAAMRGIPEEGPQ